MSSEERAAIYISLGQTYADLQQYDNAILYYKQEVAERKDNFEQASGEIFFLITFFK